MNFSVDTIPFGDGTDHCPPSVVCRYWIGVVLEKPKDPTLPLFRCSDIETLAEGTGCKEVSSLYE